MSQYSNSQKNCKMVKKNKRIHGISIQFIPFVEIRDLNSNDRIRKILNVILGNNLIILQGKLKPEEEARLIGDTMAMIGHIRNFKGVELAVISGEEREGIVGRFRKKVANALSGVDTGAITIIGPATIVKEIKKNPRKIELLLNE